MSLIKELYFIRKTALLTGRTRAAGRGNMALQHLDLAKNEMGEGGTVEIGQAVGANVRLATLDVSYNNVGDAGAIARARGWCQ